LARALAGLAAAAALAAMSLAGCGEAGVGADAKLSVYVSAPLCAEAREALAGARSRAGDYRLRAVCVDDARGSGATRLAAIGAAARRATEDSATIAYIGAADPVAVRFSEPILEEADVPRISSPSGRSGAERLLRALRRAGDSGSLRETLAEELR